MMSAPQTPSPPTPNNPILQRAQGPPYDNNLDNLEVSVGLGDEEWPLYYTKAVEVTFCMDAAGGNSGIGGAATPPPSH